MTTPAATPAIVLSMTEIMTSAVLVDIQGTLASGNSIYKDVFRNLSQWHQKDIPIYVYSSMSKENQKAFFKKSSSGDIASFFVDHFDTTVGSKQEKMSYSSIAEKIHQEPKDVLFFSDVEKELNAASEAGMQTVLVSRDTSLLKQGVHLCIKIFDQVLLLNKQRVGFRRSI